jgi:hypothetical protein
MPLYICVKCHDTFDFDAHPSPIPGCADCRQRLQYFGRESAKVSREAMSGQSETGAIAASQLVSRGGRTLWMRPADMSVLDAETQLRYDPQSVDALHFLAVRSVTDSDWARAIAFWKRLVTVAPHIQEFVQQLAETQLLATFYADAERTLGQYLTQYPHDSIAHYNMAIAIGNQPDKDISRAQLHAEACIAFSEDASLRNSAQRILEAVSNG